MEKEIIKKIIEAGNLAPSGGNSQPWRFIVENDSIKVIALPDKDHKILNIKNRGTWVAHGALLKNFKIAAENFGFEPVIELFPEMHVSAIVKFKPADTDNKTELYEALFNRHSNRKPYDKEPLPENDKKYLQEGIHDFPQCELVFVEGEKIKKVAENVSYDTVVSLQNRLLHKHLFDEVLWNEEEQHSKGGLYFKTMEMAPPKSTVFKLFKMWHINQFFGKIGFRKKILEETSRKMGQSALWGAITVNDEDINFLHAGGLIQDIWLRATKLGYSFQLVVAIAFLWQQANFGNRNIFSHHDLNMIENAYKNLKEAFGVKDRIIALMFRIGKSGPPLAVSHKRPPQIEWN